MIPVTGPISIEDFKKSHGCYTPFGNPEFGGASSPDAPFELSSIYTKEMIPNWHQEYVGDQQDMDDMRGCVASLNRENWRANESHRYPGRTLVYYANPDGMGIIAYAIREDGNGETGANFRDPWGTNIRHTLRGKAKSSALGGTNSAVVSTWQFYMEGVTDTFFLKFKFKFMYSGEGPSQDPTPPPSGKRQGVYVIAAEYGDTWAGSDSNVVLSKKITSGVNSNSRDEYTDIKFSADRPYKLISLQTNNHGHPDTQEMDTFRSYWGNFYFSKKTR